jgi:hypothetical protein
MWLEQAKRPQLLLSPRSDRRERAGTREDPLSPTRGRLQRGYGVVIRLWGAWWTTRDFQGRPNTRPFTKRDA